MINFHLPLNFRTLQSCTIDYNTEHPFTTAYPDVMLNPI
ncbi:hypothetical protein midi_00554 [Candidatus Midichloria mitochondrii IricVA]|uniref:Uncharacterized protein n=1 Tax=Midichloria mitochondrii (strain IricVA) TaxID=696127 RepID=F7XW09_MIDMI|nr:hypothetical protein midi_00554 [Candidatus Midichloria mitochondrii IricVA]